MTLSEARRLHFNCVIKLGVWLLANGYEAEGEQWKRTIEEATANAISGAGIYHSLHLLGLAIDLDIFKDGIFLKTVEQLKPIGEFWKTLHPLCRWGGDFMKMIAGKLVSNPDADHFSLEWQGVK